MGWPIILFLMAERLRNLGRYTFADVASFRFAQPPSRIFAAFSTLSVVVFYLIAQMVGAGQLIKLLFGLPYEWAVVIVGGMIAGGTIGVTLALLLTLLSPTVWVTVLGHEVAIYPYNSPTIFSMPLAFLTIWLVSLTDRSARADLDRAGYAAQRFRAESGIGAETASEH